mgnify:CR=1 FL=1
MALFLFTKGILEGTPINIFNNGEMFRDFTYIDDIIEGVVRVTDQVAAPNPNWSGDKSDPATSYAPFKIYNIGNNNPVKLMDFVEAIENELGIKAIKNMMPMQPGDVPATFADVEALVKDVGYRPETDIIDGVNEFVKWYSGYTARSAHISRQQ